MEYRLVLEHLRYVLFGHVQTNETMMEQTSADCDRLDELLLPGVGADHRGQVGVLQELVHGALLT